MRQKIYKLLTLLLATSALASCNQVSSSSTTTDDSSTSSESTSSSISSSVVEEEEDAYKATISFSGEGGEIISPEDVTLKDTLHSAEDEKHYNTQVLPSIGDVNLLVIPVLIPGYSSFTIAGYDDSVSEEERLEDVRNDIETSFFGDAEDTGYESVKSYYYKSSFGKLNLGGVVTEWFDVAEHTSYTSASSITIDVTYEIAETAVNWALSTQEINASDYDYDNDGFIDGVWLVYSAEDYANDGPYTDDLNYWAYTSWGNQDKNPNPNRNEYYYNLFGWASYDFMYEGYGKEEVDAHTFIHETGHFLGLNDYYSDRSIYNPVGKTDMMDGNIIDLNSYSKMLLGWTKPYIATSGAEIEIGSMEDENQLIVVLPDDVSFDGTFDPFSEYLLIELYTPTGLNEQDSITAIENRPLAPKEAGLRVYHIDNRRFVTSYDEEYDQYFTREYQGEELSSDEAFIFPITNYISYDQYYYYLNVDPSIYPYDEIRMIEKGGVNTFSSGGYQTISSYFVEGDSFSMESYASFFLNDGILDNGSTLSTTFEVTSIKEGN